MTARAAFWASLGLLAWVYGGYPLAACVAGRLRPIRLQPTAASPRLVTVGIAAHDAAAEIQGRIANVLDQVVPYDLEVIVASDGSNDGLVEAMGELLRDDPRVRLLALERIGQGAAQAAIFEAAAGDVVVLTDAETRFADGCLSALVAPFSDPRVGCTTGVLRWRYDRHTDTARHEGLYWRYEQLVRRWESRAGWLTAATGALLAVRRSAYRPAPAHASLDQMLPLHVRDIGMLVMAVQPAVGRDRGSSSLSDQFWSRTRIATQGIEANLRMAPRLSPWRRPGVALAIWSHKLLRWATPWLALATVFGALRLVRSGRRRAYLAAPAAALATGVLAIGGYIAERRERHVPLAGFARTVMAVNGAFSLAWVRVLARRRIGSWTPSRGSTDR